jgi:glycine/D-amino acid oxidase-like deaminating enzyme
MPAVRVLMVGGGIFGVTGARVLAARGHGVRLLDPGLPHPLAESTDISKVVRIEYGPDADYMALAERALEGWRRWNAELGGVFHETGVAFLAGAPMAPGGFEHESHAQLLARGHRPERLDAAAIARRFPAFRPGALVDGFYHAQGGWVAAARAVERLAAGCEIIPARGVRLILTGDRVVGVEDDRGQEHRADVVVVATGAWVGDLVPWLASSFRPVGQPVFHLRPQVAPELPVFGADIARTGWYGFPAQDGVVKIANHGVGVAMHPSDPRETTPAQERELREFLAAYLPGLADASIVSRRLCVYGDTLDEHFWIAADPEHPGLVVASGGSGHGFKFGPVLGELIADAAEGRQGPARFRWRPELATPAGEEAARHRV